MFKLSTRKTPSRAIFAECPDHQITTEYIGWFSMRLLPVADAAYLTYIVVDLHTTLYMV
jgi:hypothetical protein